MLVFFPQTISFSFLWNSKQRCSSGILDWSFYHFHFLKHFHFLGHCFEVDQCSRVIMVIKLREQYENMVPSWPPRTESVLSSGFIYCSQHALTSSFKPVSIARNEAIHLGTSAELQLLLFVFIGWTEIQLELEQLTTRYFFSVFSFLWRTNAWNKKFSASSLQTKAEPNRTRWFRIFYRGIA